MVFLQSRTGFVVIVWDGLQTALIGTSSSENWCLKGKNTLSWEDDGKLLAWGIYYSELSRDPRLGFFIGKALC